MTLEEFLKSRSCTVSYSGSAGKDIHLFVISCPNLFHQATLFYKESHQTEKYWSNYGSKLIGILANGFKFPENPLYDADSIREIIDRNYQNLHPEEKLDAVLEHMNKFMKFTGDFVTANSPNDNEANKFYFTSAAEWLFYLDACTEKGYLKNRYAAHRNANEYRLTVEGLNRLIKINEQNSSRYCFVAMSFDERMFEIYEKAIEPAIKNCGFEPYIVSKVNVESDKTVNDAIIAGLKKAKFTIADFTEHKDGVYFEAGYALGRGQKVIYTCKHDHMNKAHFDIRNYQHIIWKDADDFKKQLINKIEAFIKD